MGAGALAGIGEGFAAQLFDDFNGERQAGGPAAFEDVGAQAEHDFGAVQDLAPQRRQRQGLAGEFRQGQVAGVDFGGQEVHLGRADEACNEQVVGVVINFERRAGLFDPAFAHHDDLVGQSHRLDLVVGHIDDRGLQLLMQAGDFDAHMDAQFGVQVGQGFVKQKDLRLAHDGAANGDPLTLATGQVFGFALHQGTKTQNLGGGVNPAGDFVLVGPGEFQGEAHVFAHIHMGVERVALEHHRNAALAGIDIIHPAAADRQITAGDILQARDHPEQGGFAAARRAYEHHEFLG